MNLLALGNTRASVGDTYLHNFFFTKYAYGDGSLFRGKLKRIRKQVVKHFTYLYRVEPDRYLFIHRFEPVLNTVRHGIILE